MTDFATVAKVGAIAEGEGETFTIGETMVAVFLAGGDYYAIDDLCPHMGASLGAGAVEDDAVTCPWHAWRFSIRDGSWLDSPRVKINSYEVRVDDDEIQVKV